MIEKVQRITDRPDPVARLAIVSIPMLLGILGVMAMIFYNDIKATLDANTEGRYLSERAIALQEQVMGATAGIVEDHEDRLRALEAWQRATARPIQ